MISITHSHRRCLRVMILTALLLGCMGGILHSSIDVLGGATPKHQTAADEKLTGEYVFLFAPSLPLTPNAQSQLQDSFGHRTASLPEWHGAAFRLYVPADNPALCAYARHWADRLAAQHITVQVVPMNAVMLYSRLRIDKYETAIVPASFIPSGEVLSAQQFCLKSYEMR